MQGEQLLLIEGDTSTKPNGNTSKQPRKVGNTKTENYVRLMGYLGADPKIYATINGHQYAIFRLATFEKGAEELTTWHIIKMWGKARMVYLRNNLISGSHVMVQGRLEYGSIPGEDGTTRQCTQIVASKIMNLDR
ncbi:MAG: single-stranded DNA-binding protein [Agriterribacter sp.]